MLTVTTQNVHTERVRFTWPSHNGSIYVSPTPSGGRVAVSSKPLKDLAISILGNDYKLSKHTEEGQYFHWYNATLYQLADLLHQADRSFR